MRPRDPVGARVIPPLEAFQRLVEHAPDVIVRVGLLPRPCLEYINPAVHKISGYPPEDWYREPDLALRIIHPADRTTILGILRTMRLPPQPFVLRWIAADGHEVRTEIRATGVRASDGSLKAIEAIARDVTARTDDGAAAHPAASITQPRMEYCGIALDPDRLEVTWNERTVRLTLKEVLLLKYLIRHSGEMLSRDRLLHDVWGYEFSGRSRTLDVHVCRLRRKLPPLASSLLTIDHVGYTLAKAEG